MIAVQSNVTASPPTPRSKSLVEPKIHASAYVHAFSNIIGDVHIGANVTIAPGISIRADEGNPFAIGANTNIQDGVVIHGLEQGRVLGDDRQQYSVWIGTNTSIAHMALIHGPAYVGNDCFIGFRSTVFNARVGDGCIVMMHALIQDVEIPPGKYVPSGAIVTNQQQADRLSDVLPDDLKFASNIININDSLRPGDRRVENNPSPLAGSSTNGDRSSSLAPDVIANVRNLLAQGYSVGTEHANKRRFQTSSWTSCAAFNSDREAEILSGLENCLHEHSGEYVRLIGIDTHAKRRVLETIIQRPGDRATVPNSTDRPSYASAPSINPSCDLPNQGAPTGVTEDTVTLVRQLLSQGSQIAVERADKRRFQTSSWNSCDRIESQTETAILSAIANCISNHPHDYVRVIGVDPHAKRRVAEKIVHRPGGAIAPAPISAIASSQPAPANRTVNHPTPSSSTTSSTLALDVVETISRLIAQGCAIFTEFADERRYKSNAWETGGKVGGRTAAEIVRALESIVGDRPKSYVRIIGVDQQAKKRTIEKLIHHPVK